MTDFKEVKVLDNFYQTSSFYPMPVVLATTVSETGITNIGSYSLCFPFGIAEKHRMMLISRSDSNTSINIQRSGLVALNFIPYSRKYLKNAVRLGYPGETSEQKQKDSIFTLVHTQREDRKEGIIYPEIIKEAVQVFECSWNPEKDVFCYGDDGAEAHFLLEIDRLSMKSKWYNNLKRGKGFPSLPIDYGYRDSRHFWFSSHSRPYAEPIPKDKGVTTDAVRYQVERLGYDLDWEEASYEKLVKVPRIFLKRVLTAISEEAVKRDLKAVKPELLDELNKKKR